MNTKWQNNDVSNARACGLCYSTALHLQTSKIIFLRGPKKIRGQKNPHLCIGAILTRPDSLRLFRSSSAKKETVYRYRMYSIVYACIGTLGSQSTSATMT